jgi:hypothetical protein
MQSLLEALWRWHVTRGGPRKAERDAEIALQKQVEIFFRR